MDTEWFAVDAAGFVAILNTGEDGPLPTDWERFRIRTDGYDGGQLVGDVEKHLGKQAPEDDDGTVHTEALGFFRYDHSRYYEGEPDQSSEYADSIPPYERAAVPEKPLHVSTLPAEVTEKASVIEFKNLRFESAEKLQPIGTMECISWGKYEYYLDENMQPHPFSEGRVIDVRDLPKDFGQSEAKKEKSGEGKPADRKPGNEMSWWKRLFGIVD
jgi:hypothetical protein